ncbi:MAG: hypothetical protein SCK70_06305, partial [bacterium]|nr:hypothetical protein [bacterium]
MPPKISENNQLFDLQKESIISGLIKILDGNNEQQIVKTLQMVSTINNDQFIPSFKKLIHHNSSSVQLELLKNIYYYKNIDVFDEVNRLVFNDNLEVRVEALHYLFQHKKEKKIKMLQSFLKHTDYKVRGAALLCAARESRTNLNLKRTFKIKKTVESIIKNSNQIKDVYQRKFEKLICAKVIGIADLSELYPYLHILLNDSTREVVEATIISAGASRQNEFIPILIRRLSNKKLWRALNNALIQFTPDIIYLLNDHLSNPYVDVNIRLSIPRILATIGTQKAVDFLIQNLKVNHLALRDEIVNELYNLRLK